LLSGPAEAGGAALSALSLSRPLDHLTTERLELAGVAMAPSPGGAQATPTHHEHVPPDAETLAWNRQREAEWHAAPAALEAMLRELAPTVFNDQPPPLAIGIDAALTALLAGEFDTVAIGRLLRDWVRRPPYLEALARGDIRRDLDGRPTDVPTDGERTFAAILLGRRGVAL
jgi:hypothetical protein